MKKFLSIFSALMLTVSLAACGAKTETSDTQMTEEIVSVMEGASYFTHEEILAAEGGRVVKEIDGKQYEYLFNPILSEDFDSIVEAAKGTEVNFYGWGGDENLNNWLDNYYAPLMKEKYDITVNRVPMGIEDILSQLTGELQASPAGAANEDSSTGTIDMVWINGENFATASENNMLLDNYAWKAPNVLQYMEPGSTKLLYDFGYSIMDREIPYGEAQLVMYNNSAVTPETPANTAELLEYVKKYPGKVTYPALPDFTGSAFVRNVIYDIVGHEQFQTMEPDKTTVKAAIQPALDYLVSLNPYLWNEGKTFPASSTQMENMFADGELVFGMSYAAYGVAVKIENKTFPETAQTFLFDKGMIGNTNYLAIPINSPNKAGAIVAINEMVSPEVQAARFATLRTLPVVDYPLLDAAQKEAFDKVELGEGVLPQDELLSKKLPEMPAKLVPIIEEIWLEEVVGK